MSGNKNKSQKKSTEIIKKPFNKKKWREQRYSCKAKVQKWESIKRKQAQKQCNREFKKLDMKLSPQVNNFKLKRNKSLESFKEAHLKYKEIQKIKEQKRKEKEKIRREKNEAIKVYKEKKAATFKKLCQKTRKGQPLMRGRIELMLEKIQKYYVNNST